MLTNIVFDSINQGTLQLNKIAIIKVGTCFKPLEVKDRSTYITLPHRVTSLNLYSLFKLYYTPEMISFIVDIINDYNRLVREGPKSRGKD